LLWENKTDGKDIKRERRSKEIVALVVLDMRMGRAINGKQIRGSSGD